MKRIMYLLLGSALFLVSGCSDGDSENTSAPTEQTNTEETANTAQQDPTDLKVIKTYTNNVGDLEAYYINENLNKSHEDQGIKLTIKSVEYGKANIVEVYRNAYAALADSEGKNTYIKMNLEISVDVEEFAKQTFYAYQSSVTLNTRETFADSTFSDLIAITDDSKSFPLTGDVYFIVDEVLPIEKLTFVAPAPFDSSGLSISDNYVFELELK